MGVSQWKLEPAIRNNAYQLFSIVFCLPAPLTLFPIMFETDGFDLMLP
tara:strand:- start:346 stop:489 length:144 start_codon:yes stop_codon:yes gene_type:complete